MSHILSTIISSIVKALFSILRFTYIVLFSGETELDHYIFHKPPPNPWFRV